MYRDTWTQDLITIQKWLSVHAAAWLPGRTAGDTDPWDAAGWAEQWYIDVNNGQLRWRFKADATGSGTSAPLYIPFQVLHGSRISEVLLDYRVESPGMDVGHYLSVSLYKQPYATPEAATLIVGSGNINKTSAGIYHQSLTPAGEELIHNFEHFYFLSILDITTGGGTNPANDVLALYGARIKIHIREASGAY
jgi:hypothetical protein